MRSAAGRVLGLVLVGLLVMSVVGLAASQTFINKTGKTVTGITIEFSKRVTITRHDSAFPDQSPSGRSKEFTFSGRDLRNLGRFSITWVPISAKVTDYEWVEKAQPAQATHGTSPSSEQEFTLPDPNTPAILYGNDYPGPDEPLYQPQPDEQIWLTDADGHEDIYDNDSIKINYASGFDKSQITKIDVYRNGIELRFLPQKIDVLTNAQMKTFDGNPAEHSPASNHTDHAIMGYEYEFEISTADHLWILTKTVKSGFQWHPKEIWAELDGNWTISMTDLSYSDMVEFFSQLRHGGFTGISLDIDYYVMTPYNDKVFELKTRDATISHWNVKTATISELEEILKAISSVDLEARVMTMFLVSKSYVDAHKDRFIGKAMMDPSNPKVFFENYASLLEKMVPLLNEYHVKSLVVLDETDTLDVEYAGLIATMLTVLSTSFNGKLGIDISGNSMLGGWYWNQNGQSFKKLIDKMAFLGWTNFDGERLEDLYSCWTPPLETQRDQRVSVMARNFVEFWKPLFDYVAANYSNPPQGFGEIGARNADGQSLGMDKYYAIPVNQRAYDEQEVADYFYAILAGLKKLAINSINIWTFPLGDLWPNEAGHGGHSPGSNFINVGIKYRMLPAYRVITAIIKPAD